MANQRKYKSAAEFAEAIGRYFGSISASRPVTVPEYAGDDDRGRPVYKPVTVKDGNGDDMVRTEWFVPPTVGGLCLHLGISRKTFCEYARYGRAYAAEVENARSVILAYLEEQISSPDIRNVKGVQLALESLYRVLEDEAGAQSTPQMTVAEREELLRAAIETGAIGERYADDGT